MAAVMNTLRMIKLGFSDGLFLPTDTLSRFFGWERQMNERVVEKREEELQWIWKRQMLDLLNNILKYDLPTSRVAALISSTALSSQRRQWSQPMVSGAYSETVIST
jgi:hypothetical protein